MASLDDTWIEGIVASNTHWTHNLFSLRIEADVAPFVAGQYTSLGLMGTNGLIAQPYSILNAPHERPMEFFFYTQPDGQLSAQLGKLQAGDTLWIQRQPEGTFTLEQVPAGKDLWLLATGTGVAPFLAILKTAEPWKRFERIVLVYAVRHLADMGYRQLLEELTLAYPGRFTLVPFVSRERISAAIHGHIPASLSNGTLDRVAGLPMTVADSRFMLCGNPGMVQDAAAALEEKGFRRARDGLDGQITLEAYW